MSIRSYHPFNLLIPSSAYLHSFVPSTCRLWNLLPAALKDFHLCLVLSLIYVSQLAILISICKLIIVNLVLFVLACAIENPFLLYKKKIKWAAMLPRSSYSI